MCGTREEVAPRTIQYGQHRKRLMQSELRGREIGYFTLDKKQGRDTESHVLASFMST